MRAVTVFVLAAGLFATADSMKQKGLVSPDGVDASYQDTKDPVTNSDDTYDKIPAFSKYADYIRSINGK